MSEIETEVQNIAEAIDACAEMEHRHDFAARRILMVVMMLTTTLIAILVVVFLFPFVLQSTEFEIAVPDAVLYVFLAIYTLTFSILMAIYRLHLNEAARLQHHKVGFMRIRVAGSNPSPGYQGEVREALTKDAFDFVSGTKKGRVENPVPGHPASEITTTVLNKVLDSVDIVTKKDRASDKQP